MGWFVFGGILVLLLCLGGGTAGHSGPRGLGGGPED